MKINELIKSFEIFVTNEEQEVLNCVSNTIPLSSFSEREIFIIESLIRKSLLSKVVLNGQVMVTQNERH